MLHDACSAQPAREGLLLSLRVEQLGQLLRSSDNLAARCVISCAYSILSPFRALAREAGERTCPKHQAASGHWQRIHTLSATARSAEDGSAHRCPRLARPRLSQDDAAWSMQDVSWISIASLTWCESPRMMPLARHFAFERWMNNASRFSCQKRRIEPGNMQPLREIADGLHG